LFDVLEFRLESFVWRGENSNNKLECSKNGGKLSYSVYPKDAAHPLTQAQKRKIIPLLSSCFNCVDEKISIIDAIVLIIY
jgi:hypothetical protein